MSAEGKVGAVSAKEEFNNGKMITSVYKQHAVKIKFIVATFCILLAATVVINFSMDMTGKKIKKCTSSMTKPNELPEVNIVSRQIWGAQPPLAPPERLQVIPAPYVIFSHTATDFCLTQTQCVMHVRFAQTFHMEAQGWNDIGWNFLVGGDGNVYEGRGWDVEGAHTFNFNYKSIGIALIGTFDRVKPTRAQLHATLKLIEYGVAEGKISKDYKLLGHRQCTKTESPGQSAYEIIKTWDHWSPTP